jgi:malto-oligosyltrehalose trehalohydrolase
MHIGAFTPAGTLSAAIPHLPGLAELGVTAVEVMPLAQSAGRWNWGYDGVNLFAVRNTYGGPDAFKAFVDACHRHGLAVILDVVYNHVGPEGNYLADFGPYFSKRHQTPWGEAFNYDDAGSQHVRRFIVENALFWLSEYHVDGLRLDAVHFMFDDTRPTILDELRQAVCRYANSQRRYIHLFAETNVFDPDFLGSHDREPWQGIWCDCLMHSLYSLASPNFNFSDRSYRGTADVCQSLAQGYVYAGPGHRRVPASEMPTDRRHLESLVVALQNHDAIGNHPLGQRLHQLTSVEFQMAAAALILMHPGIPLMFMGEEEANESVFPFFADFEDAGLRENVDRCRQQSLSRFPGHEGISAFDPRWFRQSKICRRKDRDQSLRGWYRRLLQLRRQGRQKGWLQESCLTCDCDISRWIFTLHYNNTSQHLRVLVRLGSLPDPLPDPLPVDAARCEVLLTSRPLDERSPDTVLLQENHAVILRERKSDKLGQAPC